ncbi:hypothetical protein L6452_38965 [Arctium lappa]|uniref:Uncharacterized protein n=1 Tax=Arctium lappa TaxID=4217 RepID=A0ACB8XR11_ARCLA|nr:hypothetical protein L6452_38965 [Arctium lappa]
MGKKSGAYPLTTIRLEFTGIYSAKHPEILSSATFDSSNGATFFNPISWPSLPPSVNSSAGTAGNPLR